MAGVHREAIQKQIHQDWANREYIEVITTSIKRITDFLNSFGMYSIGWHEWFIVPNTCWKCFTPFVFSTRCVKSEKWIKKPNAFYVLYTFRYVMSIAISCIKWKIDCSGASHRLFGSLCDKGRDFDVIKPIVVILQFWYHASLFWY